jgi:hypothetical protein
MIYAQQHGAHPVRSRTSKFRPELMAGTFRYLFPKAPAVHHDATTVRKLDAIGEAMVADENQQAGDSGIPAVFTYFGQFIDHDISAGTDSDAADFSTSDPNFAPVDRAMVEDVVRNQRTARLDLDSLYGGEVEPDSFDDKLVKLMRHPKIPGKMIIAFPNRRTASGEAIGVVSPPLDGASDLVRLDRFLNRGLNEEELRDLPDTPVRNIFFFGDREPDGTIVHDRLNIYRAIIGDARNDENLFVAQFHLAMLRFHNKMVDACNDPKVIKAGSDALFHWARDRVRWTYQWLVVHVFLRRLCDERILDQILTDEAPLYHHFLSRTPKMDDGKLPLPFEFSSAAFRFGHSMARPQYDWNKFFPQAPFSLLFAFTGSVKSPMFGVTAKRLPSNWPADWSRLAVTDSAHPDRSTRRIDTDLSIQLGTLPDNADAGVTRPIPNLAIANLRKGHLHNLPSAQSCIEGIRLATGLEIEPLTEAQLSAGPTGTALREAGMIKETPLWFYVLKEAEQTKDGKRLGELGTMIVADTLLGLVVNDANSYWHRSGSHNGRWQPSDNVLVGGFVPDSVENLLKAALVLH